MTNQTVIQKRKKQSDRIRKMTITAMLSAITALLVFLPIGMITLPPPLPAVTTVHIPVLIAALVEGPMVGCAVGFVFGICSLIRAFESGVVGLTLFFRNPLVSVVPRMLFPLLAFLLYWLLSRFMKRNAVLDKIAVGISAAFGALCNTVLCLGSISLIYGDRLTEMVNSFISSGDAEAQYLDKAGSWLVAVVGLPNGIAEAVAAALIVPLIVLAVNAVLRRSGHKKVSSSQGVK